MNLHPRWRREPRQVRERTGRDGYGKLRLEGQG